MLGVGAAVGLAGAAALTVGSGSAAAAAPAATGAQAAGRPAAHCHRRVPTDNISIQLYTLRDLLAKDLDGTLAGLAKIGFKKVENAGYQGLTAKQFRAALDRHGLRSTSGHNASITAPFDASAFAQVLHDARVVGQSYIDQSVVGVTGFTADGVQYLQTKAEWQQLCEALNRAGQAAHRAGLKFGLHNHFWEFLPLKDTPLVGSDILIAELDPRYVHFEVDIFWAHYGHHDPAQLVTFLQNRLPQFHVKDMRLLNGEPAPSSLLQTFTWTDPGKGIIDFARVFAAKTASPTVTEYIIERDDAGAAALTTAKVGFDFLKNIRF
ncbi:sugar phosphate isomerase [Nakamurella endophytica]|uniref:Sugar phosphate isomerase n=2 Tax=Nakamurella endophytica TaxID=1748367 RepID=A0A917SR62_9ACTN|nr:sugar phosphate isomerase [Nakamurella endophytica]